MKFHSLLTVALLSASAGLWAAETPPPSIVPYTKKPVSLEDCVALALKHNFDIRVQRYEPQLSRLTLDSSYAPYVPALSSTFRQQFSVSPGTAIPGQAPVPGSESWHENYNVGLTGALPTGLTYGLNGSLERSHDESKNYFNYYPQASITLAQPLLKNLWIDSTRLNITLDKLVVKSRVESVRGQIISTLLAVELAYYDLISAIENVSVQEKALEVSERFLFETRKRVEVGSLAPLDAKQAEAEVARNRAALVNARQSMGDRERDLKKLTDDDFAVSANNMLTPAAKLESVPSVQSRADSWSRAFELRSDYRQQKFTLLEQKVTLKFSRNQIFPQLDLTGGYGVSAYEPTFGSSLDDIQERRNPSYYWGLQFSIPLDNRTARNSYKSAKLRNEQLLLQFKQLEQTIMIQVDNDIRAIESYREGITANQQSRVYAEAALDAEQKKLESGKSTNYQVLQLQRDLTTAQKNEIDALASYNKALAQLAADEGSTLERLHVNIDVR
ncbi:MAG TPA: TolC family protein [Candidatus Limnocylindria bacterium]|jgi:outer membrane protein TolC|nr:TolC family protein [Candidatus Limnocylindria bacterium]